MLVLQTAAAECTTTAILHESTLRGFFRICMDHNCLEVITQAICSKPLLRGNLWLG
jgi:hypothetical protein